MIHAIEPYQSGVFDLTHKLTVEKQGHTALITINHPPANTWDREALIGLKQILEHLNRDDQVYALILTGQGGEFFSAGLDLQALADADRALAWELAQRLGEASTALSDFRGVSIAALNGFTLGTGLECALACDFRVAEKQIQLGFPDTSTGLLPCAGGIAQLARLVGEGWARRLLLLGERLDAATALQIGLIEQLVEPGAACAHALLMANRVARQSPVATRALKALLRTARGSNPLGAAEREAFVALFDALDTREGIQAVLDEREPHWRNR